MSRPVVDGSDLVEQITDIQKKIALLDGDRKAYYENSQWTMQKNKETIQRLRAKNKNVRLILAKNIAGNEKVINDAFRQEDPARHCAMRGMSGTEAIDKLDRQVCETKKQLNNLDHQCRVREQKLALLQTEYAQMVKDAKVVKETSAGISEDSQKLRILENRLDKMNLKLNEASKIRSTYVQILDQQNIERRKWPNQLEALEQGIKEQNEELKRLHVMYKDAENARTTARNELLKLEQSVVEAKKIRESQLRSYKQQAQEKKDHAENIEKRMQQRSINTRDDTSKSDLETGKEQENKIMEYEECMSKIKDATGVSNIQEIVERFLTQTATQKHLESWRLSNEKTVQQLKHEEERLKAQFEDMKYSGEAKMSRGQRLLDEIQEKVNASQSRCNELRQHDHSVGQQLVEVSSGVEHLVQKLASLKIPASQQKLQTQSDNYLIDLLGTCEIKLVKLIDELSGREIDDVLKEMEDSEYRVSLESKIPAINTRIKLPCLNEDMTAFEDDDDSGDEDDYFSRQSIKNNSQQIVDTKSRHDSKSNKKKTKK